MSEEWVRTAWILLLACCCACDRSATVDRDAGGAGAPPAGEGQSSIVEANPLERLRLPREFRLEQEELLDRARADLEARPEDPEALIWVGRRLGYLGRFQEAQEVYTRGLEIHPEEPRLYRHRGHRYISLRQFDAAVADLEVAASLIEGTEDAIEPDGLPNEFGIPTSTNHSNVWYHLGLARYLRGELDLALAAYRSCLAVSDNPDMLAATSYWLYLTLRRLGRDEEARVALEPIREDMSILEDRAYHELLMLFQGRREAEDLLEAARQEDGLGFATTAYGVGTWLLLNGDRDGAMEIYREIVAGDSVTGFGFIAAEAELRRLEAG